MANLSGANSLSKNIVPNKTVQDNKAAVVLPKTTPVQVAAQVTVQATPTQTPKQEVVVKQEAPSTQIPKNNIVINGAPKAADAGNTVQTKNNIVSNGQPNANNPFIARDLDFATDWLSFLCYGDFGVGKTFLAGTAVFVQDYRDVLYIALEGGEKGLKQLVKVGKEQNFDVAAHILVIPVSTFKQYANIYEFLKLHVKFRDNNDIVNLRRLEAQVKGFPPEICKNDVELTKLIPTPKKLRTVITDSLTEAQKYCMYQLLGIDPLTQRIDQEPDQAQYAEWGRSREMIQFLIRRLRDLPINNIFICGQDTDQDATKNWFYTPLLPGKLAGDVRGLVDVVGYYTNIPLEGGQITRRLFFVGGKYGNAHIAAKHRFGSLKTSYVDNPDMLTIYNLDNN